MEEAPTRPERSGVEAAEQLNGRYVIERLVGRGGVGEVFAGRAIGAEGFSRPVAIKRIHSSYSDEGARRSMLADEARLTARLSHSNIVAVHDLDRDQAGRLFLVMELVEGVDLASLLRTGALPLPVALFVTCELLRGLGHAHDLPPSDHPVRGFVHRDVSPQNMLISWDGAVKVSDFGLAKARAVTEASASLFLKGKLAYMSPEQANNAPLDGRSDLFCAGIMLWEMVCGARLFGRSSLEATVRSVVSEPIPSPRSSVPDLPQDVERVTMQLLERDLRHRYPTAGDAIEALLACAAYPKNGRELLSALLDERLPDRARQRRTPDLPSDEDTSLAPPVTPRAAPAEPYPDPPSRRRPRRAVLAAVLVVAAALAVIFGAGPVLRGDGEREPAEPRGKPEPRGEAHPISVTSAPSPSSATPAVSTVPAPATVPQDRPAKASSGRVPARDRRAPLTPDSEPAGRQGIRVLDLRELATIPSTPSTGEE